MRKLVVVANGRSLPRTNPQVSTPSANGKDTDMKAARLHEYGKPLVLEDVPVPDIQPDEILVQVKACGMCRSDVQLMDGYFRQVRRHPDADHAGPRNHRRRAQDRRDRARRSAGFQEGDHVVVAPGWGDGTCRHCQVGNTHICPNVRWPGFGPYGGFAEFLPVPARYLIKVDSRLKFEELAPLTDAGLTPYRGIKKLRDAGALGPDRVLGVFGIGGLGGYAVQYAKLLGGGATVVAFARNPDKLAIAEGVRGRSRHQHQGQVRGRYRQGARQGHGPGRPRCHHRLRGCAGDDAARPSACCRSAATMPMSGWSATASTSRCSRGFPASRPFTARTGATTPT